MQIKGANSIINFGHGIIMATELVGLTLLTIGICAFFWKVNALSIGLTVSGGLITALGIIGGVVIMKRGYDLKERDEKITETIKVHLNNNSGL